MVYIQVPKTFDIENKVKKLFDRGRSFRTFFFEHYLLQVVWKLCLVQSRSFFKSKFKGTPRLDCMTFVDGTTMFCLYNEQFNELRTWSMSIQVCQKEKFVLKGYKNKYFF